LALAIMAILGSAISLDALSDCAVWRLWNIQRLQLGCVLVYVTFSWTARETQVPRIPLLFSDVLSGLFHSDELGIADVLLGCRGNVFIGR
jgi:hypothetical protein